MLESIMLILVAIMVVLLIPFIAIAVLGIIHDLNYDLYEKIISKLVKKE